MESIGEMLSALQAEYRLGTMIFGGRMTQIIYTIAKLGIPDLLKENPLGYEEIASRAAVHAPSLLRLLMAAKKAGLFEEEPAGVFHLTDISRRLLSDTSCSLAAAAISAGAPEFWAVHGNLLYSIRTGKPAFDFVHHMPFFDFLKQNPEAGAIFNAQMMETTAKDAAGIIRCYDFSPLKLVVDIGGGLGILIAEILKKNPGMHGTLFDSPAVTDKARVYIEQQGVSARCLCTQGNFFERVPDNGDCYIVKQVLHDWDDEKVLQILAAVRKSIPSNACLLIIEYLLGSPAGAIQPPAESIQPPAGAIHSPAESMAAEQADLSMLTLTGGKERTETGFRELTQKSGFSIKRVFALTSGLHILEALPD